MYENEVDAQPFGNYCGAFINYFGGDRNTIYVAKLECSIDKQRLKTLKKGIKAFYPEAEVKTLKLKKQFKSQEMDEFYSDIYNKKLYSAPKILRFLQDQVPANAFCVLALTDHFIYNLPSEKRTKKKNPTTICIYCRILRIVLHISTQAYAHINLIKYRYYF